MFGRFDTDGKCQFFAAQVFYVFRNIGMIEVVVFVLECF